MSAVGRQSDQDDGDDEGQQPEPSGDPARDSGHSVPPALAKKLISATAPPVSAAAAHATSTPVLPRPANTGFVECEPMAHIAAEIARPATEAIRPIVNSAPTMFCSSVIPGSPDEFGDTFTSSS